MVAEVAELGPPAEHALRQDVLRRCGAVFLSPGWAAGSEEIELARLGMEALHVRFHYDALSVSHVTKLDVRENWEKLERKSRIR